MALKFGGTGVIKSTGGGGGKKPPRPAFKDMKPAFKDKKLGGFKGKKGY